MGRLHPPTARLRRRVCLATLATPVRLPQSAHLPTWPVRFDGVPSEVKSAPLLGEHTEEVLADWLELDAAAVAGLRQDGIV